MEIQGAVLNRSGDPGPFASTRPLTIDTLQLGEPGPTELLVRVEAAGLCHSDLSVLNGDRPRPVPMLLGHEAAGIVEFAGSAVTDIAVGDRVVATFLPRCEECAACATGGITPCAPGSAANGIGELIAGGTRLTREGAPVLHHLGVSGFATHAVVDHRSVVPVGSDVPAEVAALLGCAVLTGGGAVLNAGRPQPGETVVVVGLGGVGMAAVLTALSVPDVTVVAVDPVESKLGIATDLGAHRALTPDAAVAEGIKARVVIEAAGNARALEGAIGLTGPGGTTVTVGLPHPDARISVSPLGLVAEGRTLVGSYLGSAVPRRDVPTFEGLWREGRLPVERLISDHIALADVNEAMDHLASGTALRQVITF